MPQLRKDPVTKRWVITIQENSQIPLCNKEKLPLFSTPEADCPYCPGHENINPPELMSYREPDTLPNEPGWQLRVIPHISPALQIEGDLDRTGIGIYDMMNAIGAHEIVVESPRHGEGFENFDKEQVVRIIAAYADRYRDLKRDRRFRYIMIFKNQGESAGSRFDHPHSQIVATPVIPKRVMEELEGARRYYYYKERCVFCDMLRQELSSGSRIISETEDFAAFAPFASRFPFETWIAPKDHKASFGDIEDAETESFADILHSTLVKLMTKLGKPSFNYIIHTSPCDEACSEYFHWHIEIIPRFSTSAGFEWGSGIYVNPVPAENAAAFLLQSAL